MVNNDYTTDKNGTFEVGPLYVGIEYTIEEVIPPTGYALSDNTVRFIVNKDEEGNPYLQILEGEIKPATDTIPYSILDKNKVVDKDGNDITDKMAYFIGGTQVNISVDNEPLFVLTKIDGETQVPLPNVKFAITKIEDGVEQPATDSKGEIIGTKETVNGQEYYTVTTDENGKISEDLTAGLYKVIEVQALEQYDLSDATYYFRIGEAETTIVPTQAFSVGGDEYDYIEEVAATSDGGYVVGGSFESQSISIGSYTLTNNNSDGSDDGMIIKYNANGEVEWARNIGGNDFDYVYSLAATSDGGCIVGGQFDSEEIQLGDYILENSGGDWGSDAFFNKI